MLMNVVQPVRTLLRRPGYAITVIATLALGIGAATAVYALVHGILLSSLPFPQAAIAPASDAAAIPRRDQEQACSTPLV